MANHSLSSMLEMVENAKENSKKRKAGKSECLEGEIIPLHSKAQARLPFWNDSERAVPNGFLRSALFAAIQGKERKVFKREILASIEGVEVRFTGWQLDQSDLDVWETFVHLARTSDLGTKLEFTAHTLLKHLGRNTGKSDHEWLKDTVARLYSAGIEITIGRYSYMGTLLKACRDNETNRYVVELEPKLLKLYKAGYTCTNWEQRQLLRRKPLALWLHGCYETHAKPYPMKVETIHKLSGSNNNSMRRFKQGLFEALNELVNVNAILSWEFKDDLIHVQRIPSKSQLKHVLKGKNKG